MYLADNLYHLLLLAGVVYLLRALKEMRFRELWKEIRRDVPSEEIKGWAREAAKFAFNSTLVYAVYLAVALPFVSRAKESRVWILGIVFAVAVSYLWTRIKPQHRS